MKEPEAPKQRPMRNRRRNNNRRGDGRNNNRAPRGANGRNNAEKAAAPVNKGGNEDVNA